MRTVICAAVAAFLLAGCAGTPPPPPSAAIQSDADAYYLIQVLPPDAAISIAQGRMEGGTFVLDGTVFVTQSFHGSPVDGFILAKAPAGSLQGIRIVRMTGSPWADIYTTCQGEATTLVFGTAPGKVTYGGVARYALNGQRVYPSYGSNIEAARALLQSHYPQLVDKLVMGTIQHVPAKGC